MRVIKEENRLKDLSYINEKSSLKIYGTPTLIKIGKLHQVTKKFGSFFDVFSSAGQNQL